MRGLCARKNHPHPHRAAKSPVVCVPQTKGFKLRLLIPFASWQPYLVGYPSSQRNTSALVTNHTLGLVQIRLEELSENAFWNPIKIFQINVGEKRVNPPPTCGIVPHVERPSPLGVGPRSSRPHSPQVGLKVRPSFVRRRCKAVVSGCEVPEKRKRCGLEEFWQRGYRNHAPNPLRREVDTKMPPPRRRSCNRRSSRLISGRFTRRQPRSAAKRTSSLSNGTWCIHGVPSSPSSRPCASHGRKANCSLKSSALTSSRAVSNQSSSDVPCSTFHVLGIRRATFLLKHLP